MRINSPLYLSVFYGILFLSARGQSQSFEQIYSEDLNCINPSWAFDSRTFTVEKVDNEKTEYKLMLGRVSDTGIGSPLEPVFKTKKQRGKKKKEERERNAGWINEDGGFISLVAVKGEYANVMKQIDIPVKINKIDRGQIVIYPEGQSLEDFDQMSDKKKQGNIFHESKKIVKTTLLNGHPKNFTPIKDEDFYFITLASQNTILKTNWYDEAILPIQGFSAIRDIGISSLSASPDGTMLLVVCYDNTFTEIYDLEIELNGNTVVSQNTVDKPDEDLNFFAGIRYPDKNTSKYALMGASEKMSQNLVCKVFIVQDNHTLASFDGYYLSEEYDFYKRPVGQWTPSKGLFYYLKPGQGGGILYFWDGQNEINAGLEVPDIRDFEFSSDGKYLLVTTQTPKLIIYKVN